jgi:hypothetical protein
MARKSIVEVQAEVTTLLNDNVLGEITPLDLRTVVNDILGIIQPSYGVLEIPAPTEVTLTLGTTDQLLTWSGFLQGGAVQYTSANNAVIVCDQRASTRVDLSIDVKTANGRAVIATLYVDGVATPVAASGTGAGASNPVSLNFSALQYRGATANYEIRVKSDQAGVSVAFGNGILILSNVPVNSFV